jgi:diguanylate cyclase (GGDEF)-like protein
VARLGGDEFVLLCAELDVSGAARLAERIVAAISSPYLLAGGVTAWSGASVGVTVTDDPRADVDRLLAQADRALYAAKGDGGNRYVVHPRAAGPIPPGPNLSVAAGGA